MKNNKIWLFLLLAVLGAVSLYIGGFVLVAENMKAVSGMCIGLGAAIFCLGLGNAISQGILSKTQTDENIHRKNIEVHDERNIRIREKVGAKINQIVIYALCFILLAMGFLQVGLTAILMVSSIFLLELILAIVLTDHYSKIM